MSTGTTASCLPRRSNPLQGAPFSQHAPNLLLVGVLLKPRVKVLPPLEEHRVADELEPGRELEARVLEQLLESVGGGVLRGLDLVLVGVEVDVGLDEENVIDCVFV